MAAAVVALFAVSGFCALVDELVWLRLAMASLGATTPVVSVFLSLFMAGLGLGALAGGRLARAGARAKASRDLRLYAACEAAVAAGAVLAPLLFAFGRGADSLAVRGLWLAAGLLPFTAAMGATVPFGLAALRKLPGGGEWSFTRLYLANTAGAAAGSVVGAMLLIELLGFRGTLRLSAALGLCAAAAAAALSSRASGRAAPAPAAAKAGPGRALLPLFLLGLCGMGLEVVWSREFRHWLGQDVYALGSLLALYLLATAAGSAARRAGKTLDEGLAWAIAGAAACLPPLLCDPRLALAGELRLLLGVGPVCALMGWLTPGLVEAYSGGDETLASRAYAVNAAGCLLGPLLAGFVLRPLAGERGASLALALPLLLLAARKAPKAALGGAVAAAVLAGAAREPWSDWPEALVARDAAATVVAGRAPTGEKMLTIDGSPTTILTPITKMMAHLPLALHPAPESALVVCFGMGTTFRSLASWGIDVTAVELVPSVPGFFPYFHPDAEKTLARPGVRIVIDDGRRFLEAAGPSYDLITLDPPPPPEAPGVSMLYSRQFYAAAKKRLAPGGILQQWHMGGDPATTAAMARALAASFAYVRAFPSLEGWGAHFLASDSPLPRRTPAELARRLPPAAGADMLEWGPEKTAEAQFARMLSKEIPVDSLFSGRPEGPLDDDRPVNEYFLLRRLGFR